MRARVLVPILACLSVGGRPAWSAPRCGPPVERVIAAALEQAGLNGEEARSWRRRLAWSALLPRVAARLGETRAAGELLDLRAGTGGVDLNNYLALRWEIRATWDLSRLLFDSRELRIADRARQLVTRRQQLLEQVVRLYFERCRLLLSVGTQPMDRDQGLAQTLELQRLTALLDGLSGGLFSSGQEHLEQRQR